MKTLNLTDCLYKCLLSVFLREPELLQQLRTETADQGVFMALLVQLLGAKKTLEVGVFTGYSSLAVLQELLSVEL